jgi:hypothetical protein
MALAHIDAVAVVALLGSSAAGSLGRQSVGRAERLELS